MVKMPVDGFGWNVPALQAGWLWWPRPQGVALGSELSVLQTERNMALYAYRAFRNHGGICH
jgi:hypothetical protein